jgi:hypothetical protein
MGWWSRFFESFSFGVTDHQELEDERCFSGGPFDSDSLLGLGSDCINPATGLPMIGGCGGVVAAGNVFGSSDDFSWSGANGLDDSFHSASLHDCCFNPATGLPMVAAEASMLAATSTALAMTPGAVSTIVGTVRRVLFSTIKTPSISVGAAEYIVHIKV